MSKRERPAWMDRPETWPGMRVDVLLVSDRTQHLGTITDVTSWSLNDMPMTGSYPTITLDDGREIGGIECWWTKRESDTPPLP